jgi:WD40 repeat protein
MVLRVWNLMTGEKAPWETSVLVGESTSAPRSFSFSPDDAQIALAAAEALSVRESATGKELLAEESVKPVSVAFSSTGRFLAAGTENGFTVFEAQGWKRAIDERRPATLFAFDAHDRRLTAGRTEFDVWDLATGQCKSIRSVADPGAIDIALSRDDRRLHILRSNGSVSLRSAQTLISLLDLNCDDPPRTAAEIEPRLDATLAGWKATAAP